MKNDTETMNQLKIYLDTKAYASLRTYLMEFSHLPSPVANLPLISMFCSALMETVEISSAYEVLQEWLAIPVEDAEGNTPLCYLSCCALQGLSSCYQRMDEHREAIIMLYRTFMSDIRWRMRLGVAMGLQYIALQDFTPVKALFDALYTSANDFELRAILVTLAHPPILQSPAIARYAIQLADWMLHDVETNAAQHTHKESYSVLIKGLSFACSVFTAANPKEGFALLETYAVSRQEIIKKIIRENCTKARIKKLYPSEVAHVLMLCNKDM